MNEDCDEKGGESVIFPPAHVLCWKGVEPDLFRALDLRYFSVMYNDLYYSKA